MRAIAAIYDIHENLPAIEAVLEEIRAGGIEEIVVGGERASGPDAARDARSIARHRAIRAFHHHEAAERIRAIAYPQAHDFALRNVLQPPSEQQLLEAYANAELR
jgi:hypothetical protein